MNQKERDRILQTCPNEIQDKMLRSLEDLLDAYEWLSAFFYELNYPVTKKKTKKKVKK